jgi:hypothetical protein
VAALAEKPALPARFNYRWFSDIPALYAALDEESPISSRLRPGAAPA